MCPPFVFYGSQPVLLPRDGDCVWIIFALYLILDGLYCIVDFAHTPHRLFILYYLYARLFIVEPSATPVLFPLFTFTTSCIPHYPHDIVYGLIWFPHPPPSHARSFIYVVALLHTQRVLILHTLFLHTHHIARERRYALIAL